VGTTGISVPQLHDSRKQKKRKWWHGVEFLLCKPKNGNNRVKQGYYARTMHTMQMTWGFGDQAHTILLVIELLSWYIQVYCKNVNLPHWHPPLQPALTLTSIHTIYNTKMSASMLGGANRSRRNTSHACSGGYLHVLGERSGGSTFWVSLIWLTESSEYMSSAWPA